MSRPRVPFDGAVLAGGRSVRMGRDKARIQIGGTPLWKRQMELLETSGAKTTFLILRPGQHRLSATRLQVRDAFTAIGPIAGIHAALAASTSPWVAIAAVDLPLLDSAWFRGLLRRCGPGRGAIARTPNGYEPLAAVYPREALALVDRFIAEGNYRLQALAQALVKAGLLTDVTPSRAQQGKLSNWNTPQDIRPDLR